MKGLEHLSLEDSYVLRISIEPYRLELRMDFALTPAHPWYELPRAGEQECYRKGVLRVVNFEAVVWRASNLKPSIDATGELDYGCLDEMIEIEGSLKLRGDWGEIEVTGGQPILNLDG